MTDLSDDQLRQLCAALGWQGGTFWQVLEEVRKMHMRIAWMRRTENACIVLAWEAAELSEGQCAKIFDTDRVSLRKMREALIARGLELAGALDEPDA